MHPYLLFLILEMPSYNLSGLLKHLNLIISYLTFGENIKYNFYLIYIKFQKKSRA